MDYKSYKKSVLSKMSDFGYSYYKKEIWPTFVLTDIYNFNRKVDIDLRKVVLKHVEDKFITSISVPKICQEIVWELIDIIEERSSFERFYDEQSI